MKPVHTSSLITALSLIAMAASCASNDSTGGAPDRPSAIGGSGIVGFILPVSRMLRMV